MRTWRNGEGGGRFESLVWMSLGKDLLGGRGFESRLRRVFFILYYWKLFANLASMYIVHIKFFHKCIRKDKLKQNKSRPLQKESYQKVTFIIQPRMKCYQSLVTKMTCKFAYQSLVSLPIFSFKNTLNQKYLQSFVRFTSMEVISIYCVFLPMFGNLRLYEIHQTPTSYQVLSMQIRLVNHLR